MLENCYEELKDNKNTRENLSRLRSEIKDPAAKKKLLELVGDGGLLVAFLTNDEPKVRKNAALLLGDLEVQQAAAALLKAYQEETTLFVKSAYLTALSKLDVTEYRTFLKERLEELTGTEPATDEKKHVDAQIRELEQILTALEGISRHTFTELKEEHEILLTASRELREVTLGETAAVPSSVRRKAALHPLGVLVRTRELLPFAGLRTYRELLFLIHTAQHVEKEPKAAAAAIWNSDMPGLLLECHKEHTPFYFRLELRGRMELDKKSHFAKRFAAELERLSGRTLLNSTRDYEVEIRLVETKEGYFVPFLRLLTVPVKRFSYRRNAISASIHPASAAMLAELAKPWLKEDAQILDPFCGVGTMLIERDIKVPAREKYGIDIFGDAIRMARENAAAAGEAINFINRDYFDFQHRYKFDEIITNFPVRGRKTKEETDAFYAAFFEKSKSILTPEGMIVLYSNEEGFVKKQLRLHPEYRLIREFCVREKEHFFLFVIGIHLGEGVIL